MGTILSGLLLSDALYGDGGSVGFGDHSPAHHARYHPLNVGGRDEGPRTAISEGVDVETCSVRLGGRKKVMVND